MNPTPLVSLVIPAFNPRFFREALQSALVQSYPSLEIIVCDDCHSDEIAAIVESLAAQSRFPLRYLRNTQSLGFAGNLLRGLEDAKGEFIKFLCDDDRLLSECIANQARLLREHSGVSIVSAKRNLIDAEGYGLPNRLENCALTIGDTLFDGGDLLGFFQARPLNFLGGLSNVLMRTADVRELLPVLAGASQNFVGLLDFALFTRLLGRGHLAICADVETLERMHPQRLSVQPATRQAAPRESAALLQMLLLQGAPEPAAAGWARYFQLAPGASGKWERLFLAHVFRGISAIQDSQVGTACDSFQALYAQWLACRQAPEVLAGLMAQTGQWHARPRIMPIVIDSQDDADALRSTLESIESQCYAAEAVLVLGAGQVTQAFEGRVLSLPLQDDWAQQLNELVPQLDGVDWFYLLRAGDRLSEFALMLLAEQAVEQIEMACCYGDEGALLKGIGEEPVFKPDFNFDLLRSYPYVGRVLAFQRERFLQMGGFTPALLELGPQDLIWRLLEQFGQQAIGHIAEVMVQSPFSFGAWLSSALVIAENPRLLQLHMQRLGQTYQLRNEPGSPLNQLQYLHASHPLVSIIISMKDQLPALQRCIESLLEKTRYSHFEVLIVDNASENQDARDWLAAMAQMGGDKLRVLRLGEAVGFAALHNFAVADARGEYVLMLSPNSEIIEGQWLDELLAQAQRQEVGIVGGQLLTPDGKIAQAGGVLGLRGIAGSPFVGDLPGSGGYMQRLRVAQNYSVLGAECLLVRKQVLDEVGGFDEVTFSLVFSEVDVALRVRREGYLTVWTPHASLVLHPGNEQRAAQDDAQAIEQQEALCERWMPLIARDPAYNQNLLLRGASFCLDPGFNSGWSPFTSRVLPRVLALPMNKTAVGHYRVIQPLLELEAAGWVTQRQIFEIPSNIQLARIRPDIVIVQGRYAENFVTEIERLKRYSGAFCIFELDDYVIDVPSKNAHQKFQAEGIEASMRKGIALCDRVVVSTQALADALHGMHPDIRVVQNMLAPHLWSNIRSQRRTSRKPRVGWGGGTSHTGDLDIITETVKALADEVEWVFFGMCTPELQPYIHEFHPPVSLELYPAKLASLNLDLALAPLEHHIFNDCKSNLRLLEYGACGYPVICTDTRAYEGYLPCTKVVSNSTEEWLQAIRSHLADPDASYRMGDQLRDEVLRDYMLRGDNVQHWYHGWMPDR